MNVNLKGMFMLNQAVGRTMIENGGGKIINMASQAGIVALDKHIAYGVAKAGVIYMTKLLCFEWAQYNINVNAISPTVILTPMGEAAWEGEVGEAFKKPFRPGVSDILKRSPPARCSLRATRQALSTGKTS